MEQTQEYVVVRFKKEVQPTRYIYLLTPAGPINRDEGDFIESDTEYRQTRAPDDSEFVSVIVCASSEAEAKKILPYNPGRYCGTPCGWVRSLSDVSATLLGTADPSIQEGLISSGLGAIGHKGTIDAQLRGWITPYSMRSRAIGNRKLFKDHPTNPNIEWPDQEYLGTYKGHDLYWDLEDREATLIAKYGPEDYEFKSAPALGDLDEHLKEAHRLAESDGRWVGKPRG